MAERSDEREAIHWLNPSVADALLTGMVQVEIRDG